ncbi:MAG: helix-turn-helix transcriptional regulator [Lachnospiraceae bacterium]|jgi:transcriptional regulator with XRE-family HTH domain|nr:helix-turn-helix transcriptional regulator [Eubacterium sp.]MCI6795115.1 helix-turn-helix transcriptional regulator [Lachnospiraceae bacterium]MDD6684877.1 helix-turn-helix transcriptional regulator [Lachnospiraceae bacterium]MDD7048099.1 helix-turn-helix transcriptional regulator [Lachnospiraceae bacterium]HBB60171.1 hypothetical protein [Lachnospiraceae bacterium]
MPEYSSNEKNNFTTYDVNGRLQELLKNCGVSKYQAARIAGISRGTVYSWFRRSNSPKVSDLEAICQKVFHMTLADFFRGPKEDIILGSSKEAVFLEQFRTLTEDQKSRLYETVDDFVQANANRSRSGNKNRR